MGVLLGTSSEMLKEKALVRLVVAFAVRLPKSTVPLVTVTYSDSVVSVAVPDWARLLPTFFRVRSKPASSPKLSWSAPLESAYSLMTM